MRSPWVIFCRTDFPSIYSIPKHYPHTPPWEEKKHPKGQIQHVLCKGPAGDSGGFWSLNKTEFLWCWSSGSLDSGATTRSCDTGSAHPETRVLHLDICFRALIGFGFPVSEVSSELEILCFLHHHNFVLDAFHSRFIIPWVSARTVSLGTHHNPISLGSANAIIQKWIVLRRFQEFSTVCEPASCMCVFRLTVQSNDFRLTFPYTHIITWFIFIPVIIPHPHSLISAQQISPFLKLDFCLGWQTFPQESEHEIVCAKTVICSFLLLGVYNVRLLTYGDLLLRLASSSLCAVCNKHAEIPSWGGSWRNPLHCMCVSALSLFPCYPWPVFLEPSPVGCDNSLSWLLWTVSHQTWMSLLCAD